MHGTYASARYSLQLCINYLERHVQSGQITTVCPYPLPAVWRGAHPSSAQIFFSEPTVHVTVKSTHPLFLRAVEG